MLYPDLKLAPHVMDEVLKRSYCLKGMEQEIINTINNDSIHVRYEGSQKELRFFRIEDKFYLVAIAKQRQTIITILHPQLSIYRQAVKAFERTFLQDSDSPTFYSYVAWREKWLIKNGWSKTTPTITQRPKYILAWGGYSASARWNGQVWIESQTGTKIEPERVWFWKDRVARKEYTNKPFPTMFICQECAKEHADIDEKHFSYAKLKACGNCQQEKPCLIINKSKTDLFPEEELVGAN